MSWEVCYVIIVDIMEMIKLKNKSWPSQGERANILESSLSPQKLNKSVFWICTVQAFQLLCEDKDYRGQALRR